MVRHGWDPRLAALVAHHSGATFVATQAGLEPLIRSFHREDGRVSDALTYADQTVGPWGRAMTINDRIADAITRHGPDSPTGQAHTDRRAYLLAVADRVEHRRSARQIIPTNTPNSSDPPRNGFTSSG